MSNAFLLYYLIILIIINIIQDSSLPKFRPSAPTQSTARPPRSSNDYALSLLREMASFYNGCDVSKQCCRFFPTRGNRTLVFYFESNLNFISDSFSYLSIPVAKNGKQSVYFCLSVASQLLKGLTHLKAFFFIRKLIDSFLVTFE